MPIRIIDEENLTVEVVTPPSSIITDGDGTVNFIPSGGSFSCKTVPVPSGIYYQRPRIWTQFDTSATEGTPPWHKLQGTYNYTPPINPQYVAAKANQYEGSDANCVLASPNAFGNNFRYTNDIGQQYLEGFNVSDSNTSFNKKYCIDHLTGLAVYVQQATTEQVSRTWAESVEYAHGFSYAGFSDWRIADISEFFALFDYADFTNAWGGVYSPWTDPVIRNYGGSWAIGTREADATSYYYRVFSNTATINQGNITGTCNHILIVRNHF